MACKVSRWKKQRGMRCRVFDCGDRQITECLRDAKWRKGKAGDLPATCVDGCDEEEIVLTEEQVASLGTRKRKRRK